MNFRLASLSQHDGGRCISFWCRCPAARCWRFFGVALPLLFFFCLFTGCRHRPSQVVPKSRAQLESMTMESFEGRRLFHRENDLVAARQVFTRLSTERHASQPLFFCELASISLLQQDHDTAGKYLRDAVHLLEKFYDTATEKEAASLWGSEAQKDYKGDPYERATLYMLYGLWFLENQDPENALICFKRGLLMDGDTEHAMYQADYGLLFFLAAKCHDLQGEAAQRDAMLLGAFRAYMSLPEVAAAFLQVAGA